MRLARVTQDLTPRRTFFELMRRVEVLERERCSSAGRRCRSPMWLRIEQSADMQFASTEVVEVRVELPRTIEIDDHPRVNVIQRHFGLFAPYGPMPLYVTEHAIRERRFERNAAFERFLNVVCGDLAWLHYIAWSLMHPVLGYERARNPFAARVTALANASESVDDDVATSHEQACRRAFAGIYCAPRRSLADLQRVLARYFRVPLRVVPRYGRWIPIQCASRSDRRLGTWRLGTRIWDVQHSMEIVIGPIEADEFHRWQRRSAAVTALCAVATDFVDGMIDPVIKVQVRTRPDLVGKVGRTRMGVDAWIRPNYVLRTLTIYENFRDQT
ncbi:type VI secretion protein [Burkholderia cepacia]|uniref:type VI secretion system baseplate subunit TssG n=1 Tax=Burkholderia cepacia TaxID=292 RepID=UPI0007586DA0|nr:type VI secretion system baseplate subunit TssG [Burkholderia cepacia]KVS53633.1 type VI secretion protein [Burkholderia cepacia]KVS58980.1 type VI secretion protein [Burkholderia cepacia]RQT71875.1 type VI secretion system baseplate subunit TssG [Burkholderia cepacia]RQT92289.1 type VI secretion system baseplate subunit TssG [Burkholderia cepacia]RQZ68905.1 type VI secretion system baseplate subunit TssG [Burkholderia cepacia]